MLRCVVHPSLDREFYEQRVEEVEEKMEGEEMIDITFLFLSDMEECDEVCQLAEVEYERVAVKIERHEGPTSFRYEGEEYVIIQVDEPFMREDAEAVRGLIAHEMMHTVQRHSGVEEDIERAARGVAESVMVEFRDRGYSMERALGFIRKVLATAVLCLKDIYANTEIIRQSFASELEEYYYRTLGLDRVCPVPEFFSRHETLDEIEDAIVFKLQLLPAWMPFEGLERERAEETHELIKMCYEKNLPQASYYIDQIMHLYFDEFQDRATFNAKFFDQVLESSYELIDKKLGNEGAVAGRDWGS